MKTKIMKIVWWLMAIVFVLNTISLCLGLFQGEYMFGNLRTLVGIYIITYPYLAICVICYAIKSKNEKKIA